MRADWRRTIVALVALALAAGCGKKEPEGVEFLGGLHSYMTPGEARKALKADREGWQIVDQTKPLPSDTRPLFTTLSVEVKPVAHLGYGGDITLLFYNSRLLKAQFYPDDFKGYSAALGGHGVYFGGKLEDRSIPDRKVWIGKEADGRMYVGWEDLRLRQEMNDWIAKYGQAGQ